MSLRASVRVAFALGAFCVGGALWSACSIPVRDEPPQQNSPCLEGCPESDASVDSPSDGSQVGFDGGLDGGVRNANCGAPTGCNPDPDNAVWSCGGTLLQQIGDASPMPTPTAPFTSFPHDPENPPSSTTPPADRRPLACQIVRASEAVEPRCVRSGKAVDGEACQGVYADKDGSLLSDCAPGFACVRRADDGSGSVGQCRPYCCFGGGCGPGTWCTQRRLFESNPKQDPLFVPICAPTDNCALLETGVCPAGLACVLVADRTTSCDVPGKGVDDEPCPCAEGFACALGTKTCRQICRLGAENTCSKGSCVGGGDALPVGFGLCVSGVSP